MTIVARYLHVDDCTYQELHLIDCDDEGYCNRCGSKDGIPDPPVQRTFEWLGVAGGVLPIAPHPDDQFRCEDTGDWKRRDECLFSYDGKAWLDNEERYEYETDALVALAEALKEGLNDRIDHDDSIEGVKHSAFNDDPTWREYVGNYYRDDCDDCTGHTDAEFEAICDDLRDRAETVVKTTGYSDFDYDLLSWDVGEVHDQIDVNDFPILKALHGREGEFNLEFAIEDYVYDTEFVKCAGKFVSRGDYPSLDLMVASDKTYWWGCSHETMEEVYHEHVDCDD
jgi:hypothetical protein